MGIERALLGELAASEDAPLRPPPITHGPTLGEILGAALAYDVEAERREAEERLAASANYRSAWRLADELAPKLGVVPGDVFNALTYVPDNMLHLLASPEGWGMLAEFVAGRLNVASPSYVPVLH